MKAKTQGRLTPRQAYEDRQRTCQNEQSAFKKSDDLFALARGISFLLMLVLTWASIINNYLSLIPLAIVSMLFFALTVVHSKIAKELEQSKRAAAYYTSRITHLDGGWTGTGNTGQRYQDLTHPYSSDLNLFVEGGLYEYICGTPTRLGEDTLATWLCNSADEKTVLQRQDAIRELRENTELFEKFILIDDKAREDHDQNQLGQWCARDFTRTSGALNGAILGLLTFLSLTAWIYGFGYWLFLIVFGLQLSFYAVNFKKIQACTSEASRAISGLKALSRVMRLFEQQQFESSLLQQLCADLKSEGRRPSWQVKRLNNLVLWLENSLRNQFFAPVAFIIGLPLFIIMRVDLWRERVGPSVSRWSDAIGQMEALCSLARLSFENPADPFPEIIADAAPVTLEAEGLCHPLIPKDQCVANNIRFNDGLSLIMVSGSNMSGKSTLLRSLGVNLVLAFCGAPVRAQCLKTTRLQIGSAMTANDSLQQGVSLFYAVISRIKDIVDLAGNTPPLFFLLDEILQGTNSHDRRIGAEGIIRQLLVKNAIGLVTTHDLSLTEIVDSLGSTATNIHFEDNIQNGEMHFDYKIHQGVVQKSNALELMSMIGLDIKKPTEMK